MFLLTKQATCNKGFVIGQLLQGSCFLQSSITDVMYTLSWLHLYGDNYSIQSSLPADLLINTPAKFIN